MFQKIENVDQNLAKNYLTSCLDSRESYRQVAKRILRSYEDKIEVTFYLCDSTDHWTTLYVADSGLQQQLTKKKIRLKDVSGLLTGEFFRVNLVLTDTGL